MQCMKNSGWCANIRRRVLKAGLVGWVKTLEKEINDNEPRYRHYTYKREERDKKKRDKKDNWYKPKRQQDTDNTTNDPEGVLIIDATPNEEVKTMIEEVLKDSEIDL